MKYLITGGLGVIGSLIARRLLSDGNQIVIIDAAEEPRNEWIRKRFTSPVEFYKGRMEEKPTEQLKEIVAKVDAVIHAAAFTGIPYSMVDPSDDWRSNVDATRALLEALRTHRKPTAVLSSIKPYQVTPLPPEGLDETAVLNPDEPYAASKAAQSMLCQAYAKSYGVPVVVFRCSNLYGPAPCHGPRHGWFTWFAISAAIGRPIQIQGSGDQSRDMLHAHDVYTACMEAHAGIDKLAGEIFNIGGGGGNRVSVGQVASLLHEKTGVPLKWSAPRVMDDDHVFVNYRKFEKATGWRPQVPVMVGLSDLLRWAQEEKEELAELYKGV